MTPAAIIQAVTCEGVALAVSHTGGLKVSGDPHAVNRWAAMLKTNKAEILAVLAANDAEGGPKGLLTADAGDLEKLVVANVEYDPQDNRRRCCQCLNLASTGRCLAASRGELPATSRHYSPPLAQTRLQRCEGYLPTTDDPDQRQGRQRWRGMFD